MFDTVTLCCLRVRSITCRWIGLLWVAAATLGPSAAHADLVKISFTGTVSFLFFSVGGQPGDPASVVPGVHVGSGVSGAFVYDLTQDIDLVALPTIGHYEPGAVSGSFAVGSFVSHIGAQTGGGSYVQFANDHSFVFPIDRLVSRVAMPSGGAALGADASLNLNWATTDLSVLTTDAMQVLPAGVDWFLCGPGCGPIEYHESDGFRALDIGASIGSYTVEVLPVPEPETWLLVALGLVGLVARRYGRKPFTSKFFRR